LISLKKQIMKKTTEIIGCITILNIIAIITLTFLTCNRCWKLDNSLEYMLIKISRLDFLKMALIYYFIFIIFMYITSKVCVYKDIKKIVCKLKKIIYLKKIVNIDEFKTNVEEIDELLINYKKMLDKIHGKEEKIKENNQVLELNNIQLLNGKQEIKAKRNELRQIIDIIPYKIFVKDEDGVFLLVNKATADGYALTPLEMEGEKHIIIHAKDKSIPIDEVKDFLEDDREVIRTGKTKFIAEEENHENDGTVKIMQTIKVPFETMETKKKVMLGIAVDITEQRNMRKELEIRNEEIITYLKEIEDKNLELEASYQKLATYKKEIEEVNKKI